MVQSSLVVEWSLIWILYQQNNVQNSLLIEWLDQNGIQISLTDTGPFSDAIWLLVRYLDAVWSPDQVGFFYVTVSTFKRVWKNVFKIQNETIFSI